MVLGKNLSKLIFGDTENIKTASLTEDPIHIAEGLMKVASLPYNPQTYQSLQGMLKIASQAIIDMDKNLKDLEKKAEVRIIVDDMIDKGLTDEFDVEEKVASLMNKSKEELEAVKLAVDYSSAIVQGNLFDGFDKTAEENKRKKEMFEGVV